MNIDKQTLKELIDGIDDNTTIVIINSKEEFVAQVQPHLSRSLIYRLGKCIAVCLKNVAVVATVWILVHDHFPDYVPTAQMFIAKSYAYAQKIAQSLTTNDEGLVPQTADNFDYKFVDYGTGIAPLTAVPTPFNTGVYIQPSGAAYI